MNPRFSLPSDVREGINAVYKFVQSSAPIDKRASVAKVMSDCVFAELKKDYANMGEIRRYLSELFDYEPAIVRP